MILTTNEWTEVTATGTIIVVQNTNRNLLLLIKDGDITPTDNSDAFYLDYLKEATKDNTTNPTKLWVRSPFLDDDETHEIAVIQDSL